jgi:mono/diheme cytochrome c family protein
MVKRVLVVAAAALLGVGGAFAQTTVKRAPIVPTSAADAPHMFQAYCAACHGKEGRGDGPAASALKKAPADLTRISQRNGGVFPAIHVRRFIEGLDETPAHGSRDMPIWGELFRSLNQDTAQLRIAALTDYLKSLQQ